MIENEPSELILRMNGEEFRWKGPWDTNMRDLLDAFYGLCVGATFHPNAIPEVMKEWAEDHIDKKSEEDIFQTVPVPREEEDESPYGPDGRLKSEDGLNGHYVDGTLVDTSRENW